MPKRGTRASSTDPESILAAASAALGRKLEQPVHLINPEQIESPHFLARCGVDGTDRISSVIVKQITSDEFTDPGPESSVSTRLLNELSTLQFLESRRAAGPWPTLWAADADTGVIVMEDLGSHRSVLDVLLADDRGAAHAALSEMGRSLAEMHITGLGRVGEFETMQDHYAARSPRSDSTRRISEVGRYLREAIEALEVTPATGFWSEIEEVDRTFSGDNARPTVIHGDAGPQNFIVTAEGRALILDFEFAVPGHPSLDMVSARLGFPHTTDSRPMRPDDVALLESAYRALMGSEMAWADDDSEFERIVTDACARWAVGRWGSLWPTIFAPGASSDVEAARARNGGMVLYEAFIATSRHFDRRSAIAETMQRYLGAVRVIWPELTELEGYPALW